MYNDKRLDLNCIVRLDQSLSGPKIVDPSGSSLDPQLVKIVSKNHTISIKVACRCGIVDQFIIHFLELYTLQTDLSFVELIIFHILITI